MPKYNALKWQVKASVTDPMVGEIYLYGAIVSEEWMKWDAAERTAANIRDEIAALGDIKTLNLYINSPGGDTFQGQAIHTMLTRVDAEVIAHIDGVAASAASFIAMAADKVIMPANASMMIHNPWLILAGNAQEMREAADFLDKIAISMRAAYMAKLNGKMTDDELQALLDEETWMTAQEAYDYGFADEITGAVAIAAAGGAEFLSRYANVPESVKVLFETEPEPVEDHTVEMAELKTAGDTARRVLASL